MFLSRLQRACLHLPWLFAFCVLAGARPGLALDLRQKSISSSRQFTIYCEDANLRRQVSTMAEETKTGFLQVVGESDHWRYPIVVTLQRAATDRPNAQPVAFSVLQGETGFKVQIEVRFGADPAEVNLQRHLLRALFVEYAYRLAPESLEDGMPYAEAPWWLLEGTRQAMATRENGPESALFQRILEVNHLPPLEEFLAARVESFGGTSTDQAVDSACALCLLELLLEQPSGHASLADFVRHLPMNNASAEPLAALRRDFPGLASATGELQKWWTLNLARLSASDRYKGLSPEETDAQLEALLEFEVPGNKGEPAHSFGVADFSEYLKLTASRDILSTRHGALIALSSRSSALYAEIVAEYEQIFALLLRGKTHGVKERLARIAATRELLLRRKGDIADYLNWFEATQMDLPTRAFDGYLRVANELEKAPVRKDPITKYLDEISREF